jgi:hypothetical protein
MIIGDISNKEYYLYALDIVNEKIKAGNFVKLAC